MAAFGAVAGCGAEVVAAGGADVGAATTIAEVDRSEAQEWGRSEKK